MNQLYVISQNRLLNTPLLCCIVSAVLCFSVQAEQPDSGAIRNTELTAEQVADGWIALFDGQSLFGWKTNVNANFRVEDGTIVVDSGDKGLLRTTSQFSDYELHVEFSAPKTTNSGVFIRTPPAPRDPAKDCYEINIAPADNLFPTAGIVKRVKAKTGLGGGNKWQKFDIKAEGNQVTVSLNGQVVSEYTDDNPLGRGYIGLQHNEGRVTFRNIRLKPLGMKSLFNGKDLSGWKEYPEMEAEFSVKAAEPLDGEGSEAGGVLHVKAKDGAEKGRGQLESTDSFGDFVLQLECKTHAENLNSGVFFRCIPGDQMMGYECQIHNGMKEGDPTKPLDCGTGGIFRRQNARTIVAKDKDWFYETLIVEGPHMAAWVNGYQVSDWSDTRKAHENPRKGLRLEAGTLMIQGHDPTTDISFRNLRAGEMTVRKPK